MIQTVSCQRRSPVIKSHDLRPSHEPAWSAQRGALRGAKTAAKAQWGPARVGVWVVGSLGPRTFSRKPSRRGQHTGTCFFGKEMPSCQGLRHPKAFLTQVGVKKRPLQFHIMFNLMAPSLGPLLMLVVYQYCNCNCLVQPSNSRKIEQVRSMDRYLLCKQLGFLLIPCLLCPAAENNTNQTRAILPGVKHPCIWTSFLLYYVSSPNCED